jgi:hypothetical protein
MTVTTITAPHKPPDCITHKKEQNLYTSIYVLTETLPNPKKYARYMTPPQPSQMRSAMPVSKPCSLSHAMSFMSISIHPSLSMKKMYMYVSQ